MAGMPELAWRSSLDWGTKNPSPVHIAPAAFTEHIRRHNPDCWTALASEGITPNTLRMLKTCCAECRRLAMKPEQVVKALVGGKIT